MQLLGTGTFAQAQTAKSTIGTKHFFRVDSKDQDYVGPMPWIVKTPVWCIGYANEWDWRPGIDGIAVSFSPSWDRVGHGLLTETLKTRLCNGFRH